MPKKAAEATPAQTVAALGLREDHAAVMADMLTRIDVLEALADEKEGRPNKDAEK